MLGIAYGGMALLIPAFLGLVGLLSMRFEASTDRVFGVIWVCRIGLTLWALCSGAAMIIFGTIGALLWE